MNLNGRAHGCCSFAGSGLRADSIAGEQRAGSFSGPGLPQARESTQLSSVLPAASPDFLNASPRTAPRGGTP